MVVRLARNNKKIPIVLPKNTLTEELVAIFSLSQDGKVLACDVNKEWTDRAQEYWTQAGVRHKVPHTAQTFYQKIRNRDSLDWLLEW